MGQDHPRPWRPSFHWREISFYVSGVQAGRRTSPLGCPGVGPAPNISPSSLCEESVDLCAGALRAHESYVPRGSHAVLGEGWRSAAMVVLHVAIVFFWQLPFYVFSVFELLLPFLGI